MDEEVTQVSYSNFTYGGGQDWSDYEEVQEEIPPKQEQDWYFSFGFGHTRFAYRYVKLHGTSDNTRATMLAIFGRNWAFQYPEAAWALTPMGQDSRFTELSID